MSHNFTPGPKPEDSGDDRYDDVEDGAGEEFLV